MKSQVKTLHVQPRYHRWHVDPGVEWVESNTGYATVDWDVPLDQCALVLVDVWELHYLKDTMARSDAIVKEKIVPLLEACRAAGLPVVHAPAPQHAEKHPNYIGPLPNASNGDNDAAWPPPEFRSKTGPYAAYARPAEPREEELGEIRAANVIHPLAAPAEDEPVIANGEELHQYCKENGILFLFFLGFNTNACILMRDYGTLAMGRRGYDVILLRDCTTGMESAASQPRMEQTNNAILTLEMFGKYSLTSDELVDGLPTE